MPAPLDFQLYARPPRIDADGGIALVRRLVRAGYKGSSPATAAALVSVRGAAGALQEELKKRARTARTSLRPLDTAFDGAWTGLRDRLKAWGVLEDPDFVEDRQRAEQLLTSYFPDGLEFVKLSYEAEWVHSERLLERFSEEGAVADIDRLAGESFLRNVRSRHAKLGEALDLAGASSAERAASSTGLAERVNELASAIGEYMRLHAGEVRLKDPKSVEAFQLAMAPIDRHRASYSSGGSAAAKDGAEDDEEEEPLDPTAPISPLPPPFTDG